MLVSRTIHPLLGFMSSLSLMFWFLFFIAFGLNWTMTLAIAPSLLIIGTVTANQSLISLANALSQPQNVAIMGVVIVVFFTLVLLRGTKATFRLNNVLMLISLFGIGLAILLLATSSNATFVNSFSRFASYNSIISTAHQQGYSPQGPLLLSSLGLMPIIYLTVGFSFVTTYYSGEIKSVKKNLFYSQVLVSVTAGILLTIIAALAVRDFGYDFLGSISYLQGTGASQYPFGSLSPFLNLFLSILTDNPLILWLLAITYVATMVAEFLPELMAVSRSVFAWSFDRVIPTKFAEVNDRLHVPVYIIIAMGIVWAVDTIGYTYGPQFFLALVSGAAVGENLSLIVISVAAIVFPFRQKTVYERSPANITIGRVPLLSITGVLSLAFIGTLQYYLLSNSAYGANSLSVLLPVTAIFLIGAPLYVVSYYYHKSKGIDLSLVFKEIPPE